MKRIMPFLLPICLLAGCFSIENQKRNSAEGRQSPEQRIKNIESFYSPYPSREMVQKYECQLEDRVLKAITKAGTSHCSMEFRNNLNGDLLKAINPEPNSDFPVKGLGGPGVGLGCNKKTVRFYWAQPVRGYLVAYNLEGVEVWRRNLPGFQSIADEVKKKGMDAIEAIAAYKERGSLVRGVVLSGNRIAVVIAEQGNFKWLIFHNSGVFLSEIGPWDAFPIEGSSDGWQVLFGGRSSRGDCYSPDKKGFFPWTGGEEIDSQVDHFFAALLPPPGAKKLVWSSCSPVGLSMKLRLGDRFSPNSARLAEKVRARLGMEWFQGIVNKGELAKLFVDPKPMDPEWEAAVRRGLFQAGADVDYVRAAGLLGEN